MVQPRRAQQQFGTWTAPQCPFVIEYDLQTFEDVGREVMEGISLAGAGGIEVGGLLFGSFDGDRLRILGYEPLPCEHAFGPAFRFSTNDKQLLTARLAAHAKESNPEYEVVGWYHSHLRGPAFSEEDVALHGEFFPEPWHILLLQRPDPHGNIRGGFFFRETAKAAGPAPAIPDQPAAPVEPTPVREAPVRQRERRPVVVARDVAVAVQRAPAVTAAPVPLASSLPAVATHPALPVPMPPKTRYIHQDKLVWAVLSTLFVLCIGAVFYLRSHYPKGASHTTPGIVRVEAAKRDGFLEIMWDASAIGNARQGRLEVNDGPIQGQLALDRKALIYGRMPYRQSAEVASFRLVVERPDGSVMEGSTTVVTPNVGSIASLPELPKPAAKLDRAPDPLAVAPLDEGSTGNPASTSVMTAKTVADLQPRTFSSQPPAATPPPGPKKFVPPPQQTAAATPAETAVPRLEPLAGPEVVQTAQIPRQTIPDRTITVPGPPPAQITPPPPSNPVQPPAAQLPRTVPAPSPTIPQLRLPGRWVMQPGGYSRSPAVPESIAVSVDEANGELRGTLEARYRSRSKVDRIHFSFSGKMNGASARFPWSTKDGRQGEIEFIRVPNSADMVEVVWHAPESKQVFDEMLKRAN